MRGWGGARGVGARLGRDVLLKTCRGGKDEVWKGGGGGGVWGSEVRTEAVRGEGVGGAGSADDDCFGGFFGWGQRGSLGPSGGWAFLGRCGGKLRGCRTVVLWMLETEICHGRVEEGSWVEGGV